MSEDIFEYHEIKTYHNMWSAKEGQSIAGIFKERREVAPGKVIITLENNFGKFDMWENAVLNNKLSGIETGSQIRITYLGMKRNNKTGRKYHDYMVELGTVTKSE